MYRYDRILAIIRNHNFSQEELVDLYRLLMDKYGKDSRAWRIILQNMLEDPRLQDAVIVAVIGEEESRKLWDVNETTGPGIPSFSLKSRKGNKWIFHKNDSDRKPSAPHGHLYDKGEVLNPFTGEVFSKKGNRNKPLRKEKSSVIKDLWADPEFKKMAEETISRVYVNPQKIIDAVCKYCQKGKLIPHDEWEKIAQVKNKYQ